MAGGAAAGEGGAAKARVERSGALRCDAAPYLVENVLDRDHLFQHADRSGGRHLGHRALPHAGRAGKRALPTGSVCNNLPPNQDQDHEWQEVSE